MAEATLPRDIGGLIPLVASRVSKFEYDEGRKRLTYRMDTVFVRVEPRKVTFSGVTGLEQAERLMKQVNALLTEAGEQEGR